MEETNEQVEQVDETPEVPAERHHDEDLDVLELTDDLNLEPDFETEETDEADEVFADDVEEGVNPDEAVDENLDEVTS